MVKICIIADTHRKHRQLSLPTCDILIHCGDFCSFQLDDLVTLTDVDAWFAEQRAGAVVCVGGNHDFALQSGAYVFRNATLLEDSKIEVAGLQIYGAPWCPDLPGFAFHLDHKSLAERWRLIPAGVDILVTHTPPHGILDLPSSGAFHLGCAALRAELARIRPKLHVFGHVHASFGQFRDASTRYVNAAIVGGRSFEVRNGATVVEIAPEQVTSRMSWRRIFK